MCGDGESHGDTGDNGDSDDDQQEEKANKIQMFVTVDL